jgi:thioredoxin 1
VVPRSLYSRCRGAEFDIRRCICGPDWRGVSDTVADWQRPSFYPEQQVRATEYVPETLTRAEVDALAGGAVLEFGANWCGICRAAQASIAAALGPHADVRHIKIADGSGLPLGRSFRVKLWPTLIFLRDGKEITRLVRPTGPEPIEQALAQITSAQVKA